MENNNKISGIYKITNPFNHIYIGQSIDIEKRFDQHKYSGSTNHHLTRSIWKYGVESHIFEILEECSSDSLMDRERFYLSHYKDKAVMFNYSIFMSIGIHETLIFEDPDFLWNKVQEYKIKKELKKQRDLNRDVPLTLRLNKIMRDKLGNDLCKQIAEDAVNTYYEKLLKKQGK